MGQSHPVCRPVGDRHLTLRLGQSIDLQTNALVLAVASILKAARPPGFREATPAYGSLLVRYDPTVTQYCEMAAVAMAAARAAASAHGRDRAGPRNGAGRTGRPDPPNGGRDKAGGKSDAPDEVSIPVAYGGSHGPDLEEVARHAGLPIDEVVRRHTAARYRVYMIGFAPGFAYLGGLHPSLGTPRRTTPRSEVPAGSVGIAGLQTGVYPAALPGGWQLIGRTPLRLWRAELARPSLLTPGRGVRFVDAGRGDAGWERAKAMARDMEKGSGRPGSEPPHGGLSPLTAGGPSPLTAAGPPSVEKPVPVAEVLAGGPLTTIQDGGRWGFSELGLPESGALDWISLAATNIAAGNPGGAAGLEVTYGGLRLRLLARVVVAVSRGGRVRLEGGDLPAGRPVALEAGEHLEFGAGASPRTYLAFGGGGLACPVVLGSRSTYLPAGLGGHEGRPLRPGDILTVHAPAGGGADAAGLPIGRSPVDGQPLPPGSVSAGDTPGVRAPVVVRAVPGPQDDLFSLGDLAVLFERPWRVLGASDRRACLLDGQPLTAPLAVSLSEGAPAGSIQVPPSGLPIVLLADHQTTGGYAKIATVIGPDLPLLGRAWPGDTIRLARVSVDEACRIWRGMLRALARDWPGNQFTTADRTGSTVPAPVDGRGLMVGESGRILRLEIRGWSHLVSVEEPPPR